MKRVLLLAVLSSACGSSIAPLAPPPPPDCQVNHTSLVTFQNRFTDDYSIDVVWDGAKLVTLSKGSSSPRYVMTAGAHALTYFFANTTAQACFDSTPMLAQCGTINLFCPSS